MKIITPALVTLLLIAASVCFATDATTSAAPPAENEEWFTADFVRTVLSVSIGGLISGLVALGLAIIANKNAIKLNRQRIEADKEKLELEFKFKKQEQDELVKRQQQQEFHKEKEKQCKFFLDKLNPNKIIRMTEDAEEITAFMTALLYVPGRTYYPYIHRILELVKDNPCAKQIVLYFDDKKAFMTDEEIIFWARLNAYYSFFVFVTREMMHNEEIRPLEECADSETKFFEEVYLKMKEQFCEHPSR